MKKLLLILCLISCGPTKVETSDAGINDSSATSQSPITWTDCSNNEGDHPCDFTLLDHEGNQISLYDLYGQPIVLDFSTMWCYYCQMAAYDVKEVTKLNEAHNLIYITVLAQNFAGVDPVQDDLVQWVEHFQIGTESTPVLGASMSMIDLTGENGWYVEAWPTFYFIDSEMTIQKYQRGWSAPAITAGIEAITQQ
jgi:thiol-disulfide isomerase/thioredoxin